MGSTMVTATIQPPPPQLRQLSPTAPPPSAHTPATPPRPAAAPSAARAARAPAAARLLLVRHGERADSVRAHPWNAHRTPRRRDPPLTERGVAFAFRTGSRLRRDFAPDGEGAAAWHYSAGAAAPMPSPPHAAQKPGATSGAPAAKAVSRASSSSSMALWLPQEFDLDDDNTTGTIPINPPSASATCASSPSPSPFPSPSTPLSHCSSRIRARVVYSSPLSRCLMTAAALADQLGAHIVVVYSLAKSCTYFRHMRARRERPVVADAAEAVRIVRAVAPRVRVLRYVADDGRTCRAALERLCRDAAAGAASSAAVDTRRGVCAGLGLGTGTGTGTGTGLGGDAEKQMMKLHASNINGIGEEEGMEQTSHAGLDANRNCKENHNDLANTTPLVIVAGHSESQIEFGQLAAAPRMEVPYCGVATFRADGVADAPIRWHLEDTPLEHRARCMDREREAEQAT